jgi:hypothetical protein
VIRFAALLTGIASRRASIIRRAKRQLRIPRRPEVERRDALHRHPGAVQALLPNLAPAASRAPQGHRGCGADGHRELHNIFDQSSFARTMYADDRIIALGEGAATANSANYAAQVAANNAAVARSNATYAEQAGQTSATATALKGANQQGKIKTGQAASGVSVNTGSAVDVQASARELNKLDTATDLHNADLQAYGYRTQATSYEAQAELEKAEAQQAPIGADLAAAGGILGSASSLAQKWALPQPPPAAPPGYNPNQLSGLY